MELSEVAPPGFGHTKSGKGDKKGGTAAAFDRARKEGRFKGSKSDMFAIMWSQKNKGDKPHYKPGTDEKYKKYQKEELTGDMKTDLEKYRVPRGPGGNPIRMGDKVRSMKGDQPLGKLKVKYGADKVREYYKKNKAVGEEVQGGISMQEYDPNMKFRDYEFIDVIKAEPLKKTIKEDYTERKAQDRQKFVDFYKKAKAAKAKKQSETVRSDSKKHGIKFTDAKGSGRMRGGRKYYD